MADPVRRTDPGEFVTLDRDWFAHRTREAVGTFFLPLTTIVNTIRTRVYGAPDAGDRPGATTSARADALRQARKRALKRRQTGVSGKRP